MLLNSVVLPEFGLPANATMIGAFIQFLSRVSRFCTAQRQMFALPNS
jgi:hypothetical protein